ncbi:carotenoid oxygenase family protein [Novosphingobium flavum]|uniref:Dioxygenase n=1 Tax=Novosphingobium aerophilum TaxID=2839843 RepID=A0A7X1KBD5_9SPHN|nr:carotenoid oxygenase family protein [Novosphingobium aerophilum]MBC2651186.1 carotenoid oxygenase family protein [Novosphingobium aerophilum]MBC2660743.1 carotenoid oxygenase family protein [Novosphingobium aerophilum]
MAGFPQNPNYTGLNAPQGDEYDIADLPVSGTIPPDVEGTFFRAVPNPAFPPFLDDSGAILSADGMISAIRLGGGKASIAMRYVATARHRAEVEAGRALFGKYRNPFTDQPEAQGVDRTVANTTPVWHAGRLLMCKEDGRPYRIDPVTLETLGQYDFDGALRSETMTAHVRIDPETGEMFFFGYEAGGLASTTVAYGVVDAAGKLVREQWFEAPYCAMMHDFTITENYALFPVYPTTCDLERLRAGGDHWVHHQELDSWLGIMPRHGDVSQLRWFRGPKGVSCYHMLNAHEDAAGLIHFDQCLSDSNAFPFIREASGIALQQWELNGRLARWTVDPNGTADTIVETVIGPPGDFPLIPAAQQGRPSGHGWMLTMNPERRGPPLLGGPVGAMFDLLMRLDLTGGPPQALALEPGMCFNEPVHVPARVPGHDGWLVTVVDRQTGPDSFEHECWVIDGGNIGAGPVARIGIPRRLRPQVHGWWVSAAQLAQAQP